MSENLIILYITLIDRLSNLMRRTLFRMCLPLALFIVVILVLCTASSIIFYSAFAAHVHGDLFRLETDYLNLDFPKSWGAIPWEEKNSSGDRYGVLIAPLDLQAGMYIEICDERAAQTYLEHNNVTDSFSATAIEVERLYNWTLQKNMNATLHFVENGTMRVSDCTVSFSTFVIKGGFVDDRGDAANLTCTFMSFVGREILQISYHGVGEDYDLAYGSFRSILNSTKLNHPRL